MNFSANWRDRRTFLAPPHYSFASFSTDTKTEMKNTFADELFLNNFYLGPDPLRKNLADSIITEDKVASKNSKTKLENNIEMTTNNKTGVQDDNSALSGITSFFSGMLNVISNAMFSKRKPAEISSNPGAEVALPSMWQSAKDTDENKILQDEISNDMSSEFFASEMSADCRAAVAHCQSKLEQVRVLLGSSKPPTSTLRVRRRPKKVFVEPNSVEDCFEDAFSPEDFENLADKSYIEFSTPLCYHESGFHEVYGPKVKVEPAMTPKVETVKLPESSANVSETHQMVSEPAKYIVETPDIASETIRDTESPTSITVTQVKIPEESKVFDKTATIDDVPSRTVSQELLVCESTEIVKNVPEPNNKEPANKKELVETCEDKIIKLKLLLQERRKKSKAAVVELPPEPEPQPRAASPVPPCELKSEIHPVVTLPPRPKSSNKLKDKRYKNPNRTSDKRRKSRMRKNIHDDMHFANEINSEDLSSSTENSPSLNKLEDYIQSLPKTVPNVVVCRSEPKPVPPKEFFDEVSGRFHSASVESDDSFQIVFNDSPKYRRASDCDSEDSFIVFEDSPDSCYTSNDVFGDVSDSEDYDSDSDLSDSGCGVFQLSASLSKSVSNLADDSLYVDQSEDEVDCANVQDLVVCDSLTGDNGDSKGLLLTEKKKLLKKDLPAKRVHFSPQPPKVHVMRVWLFAAKQTRLPYWERFVHDRDRFKRRIANVDMAVSWVLKPQHRSRVMFQRFMPWWNQQKRKELAEKKEREAQEKLAEEGRIRNEEIEKQKAELNGLEEETVVDVYLLPDETNTIPNYKANVEINAESGNRPDNSDKVEENGSFNKQDMKIKKNERENKRLVEKEGLDEKVCNGQILPYSEKNLDLNPEYASGILKT